MRSEEGEEDGEDADLDDSFITAFFRTILDQIRRGHRSGLRFELCRSSCTRTSWSCISDGRWLCVNAKVLEPGERELVLLVVENPWVAAIHSSKNRIEWFILYIQLDLKRLHKL